MAFERKALVAPWSAPLAGSMTVGRAWQTFLSQLLARLSAAGVASREMEAFTLAAGETGTALIAAQGVATGEYATPAFAGLPIGVSLSASTAADSVTVLFHNHTAASVAVPAGTLRVRTEMPA